MKHGSQVNNLLYYDYSFEDEARSIREEGIEIGQQQERQHFLNLINQGLSIEEIKQQLNCSK